MRAVELAYGLDLQERREDAGALSDHDQDADLQPLQSPRLEQVAVELGRGHGHEDEEHDQAGHYHDGASVVADIRQGALHRGLTLGRI